MRSDAIPSTTTLPSASRLEDLGAARSLRREFADDLLEDVLERYQAEQLAVLVDDEPEPLAVGLELLQLRKQRSACRDEIRRAQNRAQLRRVELVGLQQAQDLPHVDDADDVVELVLVRRQPRVVAVGELLRQQRRLASADRSLRSDCAASSRRRR